MFTIRRAALRVYVQSKWQAPTYQPSLRAIAAVVPKTTLTRAFHHSQLWRAEEQRETPAEQHLSSGAEAEPIIDRDVVEPIGKEMNKQAKDQDSASPEDTTAAEESISALGSSSLPGAQTAAKSVTQRIQNIAGNVSQRARNRASELAESATRSPGTSLLGNEPRPSKTVYVGNLFFDVTDQEFGEQFASIGDVVKCHIARDHRGLSKGFGYVEFANQEQADEAIARFDTQIFRNRRMTVQYTKNATNDRRVDRRRTVERPPSKTLYIGNMSYEMSDRDLNDMFSNIDNIVDVRVAIDRRSGQPRGFAHAEFSDIASATRAKGAFERRVLYGRQLRVNFAEDLSAASPTS